MSLPRPLPPPPLAWLPLALLLAACQGGATAGGGVPPTLRDLHGVAELEQAFNADVGKPRLILLLSPT